METKEIKEQKYGCGSEEMCEDIKRANCKFLQYLFYPLHLVHLYLRPDLMQTAHLLRHRIEHRQ